MKANWIALHVALLAGTTLLQSANATPPPGLLSPVTVEERSAQRVAYVEQIGHFQANPEIYDVLLQKLLDWAIPNQLWNFPEKTLIVCIYPDDPSTTPPEQQRLWLGMTIQANDTPPAHILTRTLPAGLHAIGHFSIPSEQFGPAWSYMYGEGISPSGYVPAGLAFELQKNDSSDDPEKKHLVDICIPVRRVD